MTNKHEKKFIINTLIGLLLTTASIFMIVYVCTHKQQQEDDWIFWAGAATIGLNAGFLFIGSGAVHKVKADLIRRQKQKNRVEKGMGD